MKLWGGLNLNWNLLRPDVRYLGFYKDYYDGPIYGLGFWWFHIYVAYF